MQSVAQTIFGSKSHAAKTQLVSFGWSNSTGTTDVKIDRYVLEKRSFFIIFGLSFSCKLDWSCNMISIGKTVSTKIGVLIRSLRFFLPKLLCISIIIAYGSGWNDVVIHEMGLLAAAWKC